jgi:hypothetical protein
VSASQVSIPRRFDEAALRQTAGNFLVTLRNVYAFFAQYANFGWAPSAATRRPRAGRARPVGARAGWPAPSATPTRCSPRTTRRRPRAA